MNLRVLICLCAFSVAALQIRAQTDNAKSARPRRPTPTASLTISTEQTFKAGTPIKVWVVLKNTWDQEILTSWNDADQRIHVDVRDAGANLAPLTLRGRIMNHEMSGRGGSAYEPKLKPGEAIGFFEQVNMLYDLKPGKYTVQVDHIVCAIGSREVDPSFAAVKSNVITMTVTE